MPFREKVKKALARRLSSKIDPPLSPSPQTCHDEARKSANKGMYYVPGEEPPPKYPGRYNKAHQDLLNQFHFAPVDNRVMSITSGVSPMASRAHSIRLDSWQSSSQDLRSTGERRSSLTPSEIRRKIQQSLFMASDPPDNPEHILGFTSPGRRPRMPHMDSITEAQREISPSTLSPFESLSLVDQISTPERDNSATTTEPDLPVTPIDDLVGTSFSLPIQTTTDLPLPPVPPLPTPTKRHFRRAQQLPIYDTTEYWRPSSRNTP